MIFINRLPSIVQFSLLTFLTGVLTACQPGSFATAIATPVPANSETPIPTNTSTPKPTVTPVPSITPLPTATAEPTPAAIGEPVIAGDFEFTIIDAVDRDRIFPGGSYVYVPNSGYLLIDLGVRFKNLNPGTAIFMQWSQFYVLEDNGDSWYPLWGGTKMVASGETYDPFIIGISFEKIEGGRYLKIDNDAYLRMIFIVRDSNQQIFFGIGASPQVKITLQK